MPGCHYDDVMKIDAADIAPTVTWGINPGQGISINENIPDPAKSHVGGREGRYR
ncbi:MAG: hypothetical protein QM760_11790 [Nibricoccus sp.]